LKNERRVLRVVLFKCFPFLLFIYIIKLGIGKLLLPLEEARMDQFTLLSFEKNSFVADSMYFVELKCCEIE
jgi:hypothetical protein